MKHSRKTNKHRIIAVILSIITIFGALPLQSVFSLSNNDEYAVFDTISLLDLGLNETVVAPTSNGEIDSLLEYDSPVDNENFSRVLKFNYTPTGKKFGLQIYNKNEGKNNSLKIETSSISLIANTSGDSNKSINKALVRNTSYDIEFGMKKVVSGDHVGKMYMYVNIDGELLLENYSSDTTGLQYTGIYGFNSTLKNTDIKNKVTFKANGSVYGSEQSVKRGQIIPAEPAAPTNSENPTLKFLGWFKENSVMPWNFASDKVFEDLTLVARFEGDIVTVSFDVNGGEPTIGNVSALKGSKLTEPAPPTKAGFEFMGWYDEKENKFDFNNAINGDMKLYAHWEKVSYAVTDTISLIDLGLNTEVVAPSSDGEIISNAEYQNPSDTDTYSRELKFKVKFTSSSYKLQIYNNTGWGNRLLIASDSIYLMQDSNTQTTIKNELSRNTEYTFVYGMKKVLNGANAGKMYLYLTVDGEKILDFYSTQTKDLKYTGIYGKGFTMYNADITKKVSFAVNGETYGDVINVNRSSTIKDVPAEPKSPFKDKPFFVGWFAPGSSAAWDFSSDKVYNDITLTAHFTSELYTIVFDSNGGDYTPNKQLIEKGQKAVLPKTPVKNGYEFSGWFAKGSNTPFDFTKAVTSSAELTAKWLLIEYSDYDIITLRDLGLSEQTVMPSDAADTVATNLTYDNPKDTQTYSRILKFKLIPPSTKYSAQIFFNSGWGNCLIIAADKTYIASKGDGEETISTASHYETGKEYDFEYGMIKVLNGKNAGKMRLFLKIDGEQVLETFTANTDNLSYTGIFGQGFTLKSVDIPLNVTYKVGNSIYSSDTVNRGSLLTAPAEPLSPDITKPAFLGWYDGNEQWSFKSNKVYSNVTLIAKFVKSAYNVTFDSNGGDYTPDTQRVEGGNTATKPKTSPQKEGMDFAYWQNTATGKEFDFKTAVTGNITLKAVYTLKKYTVTFRALGKKVGTAIYTVGDTKVAEPKVPAVNGATGKWSSYTLDGGNKVSVAIYDGVSKSSDGKIKLTTFGDITVDTRNTITRVILDIADFLGLKRIISAEFDKSTRVFYDSQSIEFKWSDSSGSTKYSVLFADNKDFKNCYVVETSKKVLTDAVGIFTPGKTYYWKVCGSSGSVSAVDSFVISDEPCRWISSGAVTNMRDGGGWETADGKRVKYGMVYRSGSYDEPTADWSYLDETAQYVFDYLAIKSEIELRADVNHGAPVFKEDGIYLHINGNGYEGLFTKDVQREYKKIFEFLADKNNYPLIYHCSAGADRTGSLAYILNGFLGVDLEDLYRDYELTSLARPGRRLRDEAMSANTMEEITERMLKDYGVQGGTFADAVENYLINACSIAPETLQKIKTLLLEDYTPTADKVYYNVDFMVKGEKYLTERIADGKKAHELLPNIAVDEISLYWSTSQNGKKFDFSKPITKNTTLYLVTEKLTLEEAEELSLNDLGIYKDYVPNGENTYSYTSLTGKQSRAFKFVYVPNGAFDLQIGFNGWSNRLWIPTMMEAYTLQDDTHFHVSYGNGFQKGTAYEMEYGMQKVLSGSKKGKYVLYIKNNGKLTNIYYSSLTDNPFSIMFYGDGHSILKNVHIPVTATFKNGNTVYKTIECSKSGLIPEFSNPTAPSGSYFAGWFESGKNYAWNFDFDRISKSTTFTSKFTSKLYTVTFDSKGGTFGGSKTVKVGDGFAVKKPVDPVKDGYYFDGWYNGSKKFDFNTVIHSDTVLTAKWTKDVYEDCDIISLNDLGIYSKEYKVNGEFYKPYVSTTGKESRIFKFYYTPLNNPQLFVGFNGWENRIWLTHVNDIQITQDDNHSIIKPYTFETNKTYAVEYGMKKVIEGKNTGKYYLYLKIDNTLVGEYLSAKGKNPHEVMLYGTGTAKISEYPVPVKATFKANGSVYQTQTVNRSNLLKEPSEPKSKDSSKPYFLAWMNGSTEWDFVNSKVYNNVTLTAKFVKSVNYVTLDYGISDYKNVKKRIETGKKVTQPKTPTRKGYEFSGWYNGNKKFNFNTAIKSDIVLKAKWIKVEYEKCDIISLNDLGIYSKEYKVNGEFYKSYVSTTGKESRIFKFYYTPLNNPQLFVGFNGWENRIWLTHVNDIQITQDDNHSIIKPYTFETNKTYAVEYGMKKVITGKNTGKYYLYLKIDNTLVGEYLSAKGKNPHQVMLYGTGTAKISEYPVTLKATFKANGSVHTTQTVNRSNLLKEPAEPKSKDSSKPYFLAWMNGSTEWDFANSKIYKNVTLTAKFVKSVKYVTFDYDISDYKNVKKKIEGGTKVSKPKTPTRKGYEFAGWYKGNKKFDFNTAIKSNIVLKAKWTKIKYEKCDIISLNDLGIHSKEYKVNGEFYKPYVSTTGKESRIFKFYYTPLNNPQLFVGFKGWENRIWLTHVNDVQITQDDTHSVIKPCTFEVNKTYAVEYGMKKVLNGKNSGKYYLYLKVNNTLIGEYLSAKGDNPHQVMLYGMGTAKISEYPIPVKATFKANGSVYKTQTVNRSDLLKAPAEPKSKDSSKPYFLAWMNGSSEWNFAKNKLYKNVTLTAKFVKTINYVTFDYGISNYKNVKKKIEGGTKVAKPKAPTRKGYEFVGWYNGGMNFDFNTPVRSNIVLKAKWLKIEYEKCDVISLNDLGIYENNYSVVGESNYPYTSVTGKESRIFKFNYIPAEGSQIQIGFNGWKNRLWLTHVNDLHLISEDGKSIGVPYIFEKGKQYSVEYGMKKILNGTNKGKYYLYVSIDGKLINEYISNIGSNPHEVMLYGDKKPVLKNVSVPVKITYTVGGRVYKVQTVNRSGFATEPDKPISSDSSKPDFYGWVKKGSTVPVNFYTDRFYEDTVLAAEFAKDVHDVTFIDDGKIVNFFRTKGDTVIEEFRLEDKFMKDYVWYNGKKPFDFTKKVTKDIILTAKWVDIELENYDILSLFDLGIEGDYGGYHNSEGFTPTYSKSNTTYSKIFRVKVNMQDYKNFWIMFDEWGQKQFWMCADNNQNGANYAGLNSESGYISRFYFDYQLNHDYIMEFGLLRVKSGRNAGKDLIFVKIDGEIVAFSYTEELLNYGEAKYIDKKIYFYTDAVTFKNIDNFYNVVFKENGKEILSAKVRRSETLYAWSLLDEKNVLPNDPEIPEDKRQAGMIFAGWYDQDKELCDVNFDPVMKDMVLEPQFGYTVTFDTGEKKKSVKVPAGWCVDEIEAPVKKGYRFDKWVLGDNKYDFSTPVNNNIVIKAKYIKTYVVKFMAGDDVYRTYEVDKGSCVNKPKQTPDPYDFELDDTYVFNRWLLNGKGFDFDTKILSDTVLKASFITKSEFARIELLKKLAPYGGAVVFIGLAGVFILIFKRKREKKNG